MKLFNFEKLEDQTRYLDTKFPKSKWYFVMKIVGNATFFNALLYKGAFVKKNIKENYFTFYQTAYDRLFKLSPIRENFFMQLSYLGELLLPEGNPIEAHEDCFLKTKESLKAGAKVHYVKENLIHYLERFNDYFDFVSLSDVPSYFSGDLEKAYMQQIRRSLKRDALVVLRSYLRVPENTDLEGFSDVSSEFSDEISKEKTQMYKIQVFKKLG